MAYSAEDVKEIIKSFITERTNSGQKISLKKTGQFYFNKDVFEIESCLAALKKEFKINIRFDPSVGDLQFSSDYANINEDYFRPIDYQYNFLYFLTKHYNPALNLHTLIDDFLTENVDQLGLGDILITESGATRCKTNLRFALDALRDIGMVMSRDEQGRRCWAPSINAVLALLNIKLFKEKYHRHTDFKQHDKIYSRNSIKNYRYDLLLLDSIRDVNNTEHLYEYLYKSEIGVSKEEKIYLQNLTKQYIEFIDDALIITDKGVKETKDFKTKAKIFLMNFKQQPGFKDVFMKLLANFLK